MSECHEHIWSEELVFADANDFEVVGDHVCDTCDVVGRTCDECDGDGCWACDNEGVKVVPGVTVDWEIES